MFFSHRYAFHAGSIQPIWNQEEVKSVIATISCDSLSQTGCSHITYELDRGGKQVAKMVVPFEATAFGFGYRYVRHIAAVG